MFVVKTKSNHFSYTFIGWEHLVSLPTAVYSEYSFIHSIALYIQIIGLVAKLTEGIHQIELNMIHELKGTDVIPNM